MSSQQPQSQDPTPARGRHIVRRARAQGREARDSIGEGGGGAKRRAKRRKKPKKSYRRDVENGGFLDGRHTHTHTHTHTLIPPWEDQREWHRMTRMTRPDCAVMCNLINTHTHTHTQRGRERGRERGRGGNGDGGGDP